MDITDLDEMVASYIETSLWAGHAEYPQDINPELLNEFFSADDVSAADREAITEDCRGFIEQCADDLAELEAGQVGHDFYLTRNRHGAGFWDRGLGALGDRLTKAAHSWGSSYLIGSLDADGNAVPDSMFLGS